MDRVRSWIDPTDAKGGKGRQKPPYAIEGFAFIVQRTFTLHANINHHRVASMAVKEGEVDTVLTMSVNVSNGLTWATQRSLLSDQNSLRNEIPTVRPYGSRNAG